MAKKKQILFPVVFMIVITAVFTFLLAFINDATKDTIEKQQELIIQRSILTVFDYDMTTLSDDAVQELFKEHIQIKLEKEKKVYISDEGYAFEFSGKGLWGTITGHIAVDKTHKDILGVNFVTHSETPGLGGRIDEEFLKISLETLHVKSNSDA